MSKQFIALVHLSEVVILIAVLAMCIVWEVFRLLMSDAKVVTFIQITNQTL